MPTGKTLLLKYAVHKQCVQIQIFPPELMMCLSSIYVYTHSTLSRHRQARQTSRAPPAGGDVNERMYCHYISTGLWTSVAQTPWNMIAAPTGSPNIIGLEYCYSDDACMALDQSAVNICLWLFHAKFAFGFGALNNAIRSIGSLSVLARYGFFFGRASSKANLKYW